MKDKTVRDAAKLLPKGSRASFIKLWNSVGVMDIYDGDLNTYLIVIKQVLNDKEDRLSSIEKTLSQVNKVLSQYTIPS